MNIKLDKKEIDKFSRQIILKNIGFLGQKKIKKAKKLYPNKQFKLINEQQFYNFLEIDSRELAQKTIAS